MRSTPAGARATRRTTSGESLAQSAAQKQRDRASLDRSFSERYLIFSFKFRLIAGLITLVVAGVVAAVRAMR